MRDNLTTEPVPEHIRALEKPDPALWKYYIISSIFTGPGIVAALPYLYFRYHTLRYRFDDEGIHMKVGILFRREVNLTYARIQDIHLRSGIIQRWLGLANVQIQTASGSSGPELIIEGFKQFEAIRDFLYARMRGYQAKPAAAVAGLPGSRAGTTAEPRAADAVSGGDAEVVSLLLGIRDELKKTRELLETRTESTPTKPPSPPQNV
jgi:putative membrane protein